MEEGKDGVGDYTRKLAAALTRSNISTIVVGVNDKFQTEDIWEGLQSVDGVTLNIIRFSKKVSWNVKTAQLNTLLEKFNPEWISLQYVPYGFNKKGVPFFLPSVLQNIKGNFKWHIMFHEMWVGTSPTSPFMHKLYGFFQRKIAISMVKKIKPSLIHTSNLLYQLIQHASGINSKLLPLFSNINYKQCEPDLIINVFKQLEITASEKRNWLFIGIFGHLYSVENIHAVLENELEKAMSSNKQLALISFGKINSFELDKLYALQKKYDKLALKILGEKSEEEISCILQLLDKGLSCTPYELIGKSGAFAAMKRHHLQVLIPTIITIPAYEKDVVSYNTYLDNRLPEEWDVSYIGKQFIKDIKEGDKP